MTDLHTQLDQIEAAMRNPRVMGDSGIRISGSLMSGLKVDMDVVEEVVTVVSGVTAAPPPVGCTHVDTLCVVFEGITLCPDIDEEDPCFGSHAEGAGPFDGTFQLTKVFDESGLVVYTGVGPDGTGIELDCDEVDGYTINYWVEPFTGPNILFEAFNGVGEGPPPLDTPIDNQALCEFPQCRKGFGGTIIVSEGDCP